MTPSPKSLFTILGEIAYVKPKLVLMKGSDYFRVEELLSAARRLTNKATPDAVLVHRTPQFSWANDGRGKVVVWQTGPKGIRPIYVEPGSEVSA